MGALGSKEGTINDVAARLHKNSEVRLLRISDLDGLMFLLSKLICAKRVTCKAYVESAPRRFVS